jgi:hypothetical protein
MKRRIIYPNGETSEWVQVTPTLFDIARAKELMTGAAKNEVATAPATAPANAPANAPATAPATAVTPVAKDTTTTTVNPIMNTNQIIQNNLYHEFNTVSFWEKRIDDLEIRRYVFNRKAAWSADDIAQVDMIDEEIKECQKQIDDIYDAQDRLEYDYD